MLKFTLETKLPNLKNLFKRKPGTLIGILFERMVAYSLFKKYKFDRWHIHAVPSLRTYRKNVVNYIMNKYKAEIIVDYACGLGYLGLEVARKNEHSRTFGYDISAEVLSAAKILANLNKAKISYLDKYDGIREISKKSDVVFCLNFMHELDDEKAEKLIMDLIPNNGILVLDIVKDKDKGYKYFHDLSDISGVKIVEKFNVSGESRDFNVLKKV